MAKPAEAGTPEEIAYRLFEHIRDVEGKQLDSHGADPVDRDWILSTYTQCINVIRNGNAGTSR